MLIGKSNKKYLSKDHGTVSSGAVTINCNDGHLHYINATGDITISNPTNFLENETIHLVIIVESKCIDNTITLSSDYQSPETIILENTSIVDIHHIRFDSSKHTYVNNNINPIPIFTKTEIYAQNKTSLSFEHFQAPAVSGDGKRLAITDYTYNSNQGIVYTYEYKNGIWEYIATADVIGDGTGDYFGQDNITMNYDGTILAVQALDSIGYVKTFTWDDVNKEWDVDWTNITGDFSTNYTGLAISGDGQRLTVYHDDLGYVKNYSNSGSKSWTYISSTSGFGHPYAISMNYDGTTLVSSFSSNIKTYDWISNNWTQRGSTLSVDNRGISIFGKYSEYMISGYSRASDEYGQLVLYKKAGDSWTLIGGIRDSDMSNSIFGRNVATTVNGNFIFVEDVYTVIVMKLSFEADPNINKYPYFNYS